MVGKIPKTYGVYCYRKIPSAWCIVRVQLPVMNHFLLVEDNESDARLLRRCFTRSHVTTVVETVRSGEAAIEYLRGTGGRAEGPEFSTPSIIFLDLQLPGMDGFQVLKWIRAQRELASTRVVVLTGSDNMRDVGVAYELGANSFMVKPADFERFTDFSVALGGYWSWSGSDATAPPNPGTSTSVVQTRSAL